MLESLQKFLCAVFRKDVCSNFILCQFGGHKRCSGISGKVKEVRNLKFEM